MGYLFLIRVLRLKYFIKNKKITTMKKFFAIAIIAASFAACNNSGEKKDTPDTTKVDTAVTTTPPADTSKMAPADTSKMAPADTAKPKM